jgi:hypothetical protein
MNTGLTEAQMRDFISMFKSKVGEKEAANANEILATVLTDRRTEQSMPHVSVHAAKKGGR